MRTLVLTLIATGCAHKGYAPAYEMAPSPSVAVGGGSGRGYAAGPVDLSEVDEEYSYDAPSPPPPPPPPPARPVATPEPEPEAQQASQQAEQRMIHYEGWAQLRVTDPEQTLDDVVALAEGVGGRTERLAGTSVSIRVPVDHFEEVYAAVLALGDVMNKSVRADDVTDAFLAVDLRAKTLRATQARLVELLAKATEEQEKLRLLQEITRVTEELDAIESQLRTLSDLASMSRISVDAVPREAFGNAGNRPSFDGFGWIPRLSPFNRAPSADPKRLALPVPEGLVALSTKGPFAAESADGAVLWTMRVANDPVGDGAFWMDAVEDRIGEEFAHPERKAVGGWSCLVVDEPGSDEPYRWQVCARVDGKWIRVAQAWFPGAEQVERYGAAVDAALTEGGDT